MNINSDKPLMIFVKDYEGKKYYKVGLSRKMQNGSYENGYLDIKFKGNVDLKNKEQIYIKNAFLTFYLSKDKHTIPYIMVMEYELVSEVIDKEHKDIKKDNSDDLFAEFGEEHKDEEFDLPF